MKGLFKKIISLFLAFVMIFGASAAGISGLTEFASAQTAENYQLTIKTKTFHENEYGELEETNRFLPGENVKVRVYVGANYLSTDSTFLFFFDPNYLTDNNAYATKFNLNINPQFAESEGGPVSEVYAIKNNTENARIRAMVNYGYLEQEFADTHESYMVALSLNSTPGFIEYDASDWLFEFDMIARETLTEFTEFLAINETVASPERPRAVINVPVVTDLADPILSSTNLSEVEVETFFENSFISIQEYVPVKANFYANGGYFDDGSVIYRFEFMYNTPIGIPDIGLPQKEGYAFAGWYDESGENPIETVPRNEFNAYARWERVDYLLTLDANGGTFADGSEYKDYHIPYADPINHYMNEPYPIREGFKFAGWVDTESGEEYLNLPYSMPAMNLYFEALWEYNEYTVRYEMVGEIPAEVVAPPDSIFHFGEEVELVVPEQVEGYIFEGWYYNGEIIDRLVMPAQDVTLTGVWVKAEAEKYTVSYSYIGDVPEYALELPAINQYEAGEVVRTANIPTARGYTFEGWYYDGYITDSFMMPADDVVLYGSWSKNTYNIILDANGGEFDDGSTIIEESVPYGEAIGSIIPRDPVYPDHKFMGWVDEEGNLYSELPDIMPDSDLIYTAVWEEIKYTITFNAGNGRFSDGSETKSYEYSYGDKVEIPENPKSDDLMFDSWQDNSGEFTSVPDTMPKKDLSFYAVWTSNGTLSMEVKYFRLDETLGDWVETEKAQPGERIKARVFIDTTFATGVGEVILFYDKDFLIPDVGGYDLTANNTYELSVNPDESSYTAINEVSGDFFFPDEENYHIMGLIQDGYIPEDYLFDHGALAFNFFNGSQISSAINGEEWFCEFDFTVADNGTSEGGLYILEDTICDPYDKVYAYTNFNVGTEGEDCFESPGMFMVYVNTDIRNNILTTKNTVTFDACGGEFSQGEYVSGITDFVGRHIDYIPEPFKENYIFVGWATEPYATPEMVDPVVSTIPYEEITYYAVWEIAEAVYTVETYVMDSNGYYPELPTETVANIGTSGEHICYDEYPPEGFFVDENISILEGIIAYDNSLVLKVYLARNMYNLSYDIDGEVITQKVYYGQEVELIDPDGEYIREGHTFCGWTDANGVMINSPFVMPCEDVTLNASFEVNKYTVRYYISEGAPLYEETTFDYGAEILYAQAPEKEGFTFIGWVDSNGNDAPSKMPAEDIELFAKIEVNVYKAIYIVDGEVHAEYDILYGSAITVPDTPSKAGYVFAGWSPEISQTMPAMNVEYYATWIAAEAVYNIETYVMDSNGIYPESPSTIVTKGGTSGDNVRYDEYPPEGFFVDENISILEGIIAYDNSLVLKVYLARNMYNLSYDIDGEVITQKVYYGQEVELIDPDGEYIREGYTFCGWTDVNGVMINSPFVMPCEDVTLNASFEVNKYTVRYYISEGAPLYDETTFDYGAEILYAQSPEKEGFTFIGWVDSNGNDAPSKMPAEDIELFAKFEVNVYKAIYIVDGEVHAEYDIPYGSEITVPDTLSKAGYVFAGWSPEISQTMPAKDIEFYAVWNAAEYTVTFRIGSQTVTETYLYGEEISVPEFENFIVDFWKDKDGNAVEIPDTMPAENLEFTAECKIVNKSNKYDVTAEYAPGCFTTDVVISVEDITDECVSTGNVGTGNFNFQEYNEKGKLSKPVGFYNIKMLDGNGDVSQPVNGEKVKIKMLIPEKYRNRKDFIIVHWYSDKGYEKLSTQSTEKPIVREGDYLVFETGKFSVFALYVVSEVNVINAPEKVNYKGNLNLDGIKLEISHADGTVETVTDTSKMEVEGFDSSKIGEQTVIVSYEDYYAEFDVTVSYTWWQWIIRILFLGFLWY